MKLKEGDKVYIIIVHVSEPPELEIVEVTNIGFDYFYCNPIIGNIKLYLLHKRIDALDFSKLIDIHCDAALSFPIYFTTNEVIAMKKYEHLLDKYENRR